VSADGNCRRHLRNVLLLTLTLDGAVLCALALLVPPMLLCAAVPVPRRFLFVVKIGREIRAEIVSHAARAQRHNKNKSSINRD